MTKRFWMFVTFAGVVVSIAGLIATIVLVAETGERVPDSECSDAMAPASLLAACFTSDDPKVLLGIIPLMLGLTMVGVGIWRWIATPSDGSGGGGLFASIRSLQQQAEQMAASAGTTTPPLPPTGSAPPPETPSAPQN
jgi:hypothetical protein